MTAPSVRPFADPVRTFLPWVDPEEHKLRMRLHRARDHAAARAVEAERPGPPRDLFWIVNELANQWLLAPATRDQLALMGRILASLFLSAHMIERLAAPDQGVSE